jgi:hypothetical protein
MVSLSHASIAEKKSLRGKSFFSLIIFPISLDAYGQDLGHPL